MPRHKRTTYKFTFGVVTDSIGIVTIEFEVIWRSFGPSFNAGT